MGDTTDSADIRGFDDTSYTADREKALEQARVVEDTTESRSIVSGQRDVRTASRPQPEVVVEEKVYPTHVETSIEISGGHDLILPGGRKSWAGAKARVTLAGTKKVVDAHIFKLVDKNFRTGLEWAKHIVKESDEKSNKTHR